jgi:hypothetical protein
LPVEIAAALGKGLKIKKLRPLTKTATSANKKIFLK